MTQNMGPFLKAMTDADTPVEHKAIAVPFAVVLGDVFKVFQDAPLKVIHILYPLTHQVVR